MKDVKESEKPSTGEAPKSAYAAAKGFIGKRLNFPMSTEQVLISFNSFISSTVMKS